MANSGVYVFKRNGRVVYVGRSDHDVVRREAESYRCGDYDLTSTIHPTSSARQAFLKECRLYHLHAPIDNLIHPHVPVGTAWRCPVTGCHWA